MSDSTRDSALTSAAQVEALRQEVQHALRHRDSEEILTLLSENSGWTLDHMMQFPHEIASVELFLLNVTRIPELRLFPNLTVVRLAHVGLESMVDLKPLTQVEELWLSDNDITKIEGIDAMTKLRRLYLQGNLLTSMEGLPVLRHLRELWLCRNHITTITGLENVRKLRSFWIASNPIESVEDAFGSFLTHLHDINLAGCQIASFHEIAHLTFLPCLRNVWFADPLFGENPICRLNNYTNFTLHMLSALDTLDYGIISKEQREVAESIYSKKRIYYSMRMQTLERNYWMLCRKVEEIMRAKQASAREAMWTLKDSLIPIQSALAERRVYGGQSSTIAPSDDLNTAKLEEIQRELSRAVGTREVEIQRINKKLLESLEATYTMKQRLKERLCLELHTGGNIRLEESSPKDSWYESARDLLVARFKSEPFEAQFGITGVEVSRVFRVINRGLRLRFDERVKELDIDLTIPSTRKGLVCLFSTIPSTPEDQDLLLQHALVHGMDAPANRNAEGWPFKHIIPPTSDGVPLTNSLYYADEERLSGHLKAGELSGVNLSPNAFSARLVVSRVFLGKSVMALGGSSGAKDENVLRSGKRVSRKDYSRDVFSVYRASSQDNGVRVWYCFDRALILPEFVVDFSYTLKLPFSTPPSLTLFNSTDVLKRVMEELLPNIPRSDLADLRVFCHHFVAFVQLCGSSAFDQFARDETKEAAAKGYALLTAAGINTESKASSPASAAPAKPLTEEVLKVYVQSLGCPSQLTHCYLIRQGLTAVRQDFSSRQLGVLTTLDLSFNALTEFSWFAVAMAAPQLQQLFLRGNQLTTFDTMTSSLASLTALDLSRNQLSSVHQFDAILGSFPKLKHLDTTDNPMMEEKHAELILLGYLFAGSSDITTVNMLDFSTNITANRASVAKWLRDRTLKLNSDCVSTGTTNTNSSNNSSSGARGGSSSPNTEQAGQPIALRYLVRYAHKEWSQNGTYDLMSMESTILPERFFEAALRSVQGLEHRAKLRVMTSTAPSVGTASASGEPAAATPSSASTFYYSRSLIHSLQWVSFLPNIQHLVLRSHNLRDITPVAQLTNLELLDVQDNCIQSLPDLSSLPRLAMLDVSVNLLHSISQLGNLSALRCFNVSGNHLTSLDTGLLMQFSKLEELFLAHNRLHQLKEFYGLKDLTNLLTLDVFGNPFVSGTAESQREARQYLVYHFRRLKVLDSTPISQLESQKAREVFAGKMSGDLLTDRAGPPEHWASLKQLDLTRCSLKEVSLLEGFSGLEILKLGYNLLLRLDGIAHLRHLKALNLSHNKLGSAGNRAIGEALKEIHCLESLSLESNHITDVSSLGLQLPRLKFLNLKGNDVQLIDRGMGVVPELREVILDHNKLRAFGADCFAGCPFITDLSADENVIRLTEGLARLHHLENLSLGSNRLGDLNNLINDLRGCPLTKATFVGNPVARKTPYRPTIISTFTQLTSLDGRSITREERDKAETVRTMEYAVPANVVIDLNYMSGLPGGVSGSGSPNLGPASSAPSISGGKGGVVIQRVGGGGGGGAGIPSVRLQPMASNNSGNGRGGFSRGPNQVRATTRM